MLSVSSGVITQCGEKLKLAFDLMPKDIICGACFYQDALNPILTSGGYKPATRNPPKTNNLDCLISKISPCRPINIKLDMAELCL